MKINYFIDLVKAVANASKSDRLKVGSILIDTNGRIISTGFNGSPAGIYEEKYPVVKDNFTPDYVIHSEVNCILFAKGNTDGKILICTHNPCLKCSSIILQSNIRIVYFLEDYRFKDGINFLIDNGIPCEQIKQQDFKKTLSEVLSETLQK